MFDKTSEGKPVPVTTKSVRSRIIVTGVALVFGSAFALVIAATLGTGKAFATPGSGVTSTPIANGVLPQPIRMKLAERNGHSRGGPNVPVALSLQPETMEAMQAGDGFGSGLDVSSLSIVKNIVAPGGYFGWHQHGGPSWIIVTQGTLTFYDADDPTCAGHPVSAGSAYLDMGNHTHNARNETNATVENYVVRMLPEGGQVRIDMPAPDTCGF
jgi:quercetin dioxygenase-like cupin family protein